MPESHTKSVNNSDIARRKETERRKELPCFREYTIIAILLFVWTRKRHGRNDYVDAYIMTHFRKVLDEIEQLHESSGGCEETVCRANRMFTRELQRIAENIKWIYE